MAIACGASTSSGGQVNNASGDGDSGDTGGDGSDSGDATGGGDSTGGGGDATGGGGDAAPDPTGNGAGTATVKKVVSGPQFPTSEPPEKMSAFLVEPAKKAMKDQRWALAISYYRGLVAARGKDSPEALELVTALVQENQYAEALEVIDDYIATVQDPGKLANAKEIRGRIESATNPFSQTFKPVPATKDAVKAFNLGRDAYKAKKYGDALLYYQIGLAMDPDLTGFFREIGLTYDKLGATQKKVDYLSEYLHRRPFGKNAELARESLAKNKKDVGWLTVKSALPCDRVWINAQLVPGKLPVEKLLVGPGRWAALCYNIKYDIAYFEEAKVDPGEKEEITFNWAIMVNELVKPHGRIWVENVLQPGDMVAVPLSKSDGFGIVVPADGRAIKVRIKSLDGSREQERFLKIAPGSKEVIKW